MLETLFLVLIGALIGWHFPEPSWAKLIREKILSVLKPKA
jgi:hypothetical protein